MVNWLLMAPNWLLLGAEPYNDKMSAFDFFAGLNCVGGSVGRDSVVTAGSLAEVKSPKMSFMSPLNTRCCPSAKYENDQTRTHI